MPTSGTATFNMDFIKIAEEAYERAGTEMRSGYDLSTARRSFDLLTIEWANRGINLWTIEQRSVTCVIGQSQYTLEPDIIDLLDHVIRLPLGIGTEQQTDYNINRTSVSTYATRTSKLMTARPNEVYIDRQRDAPIINLWPVPDREYTFVYWVMRRIEDAGDYTNNADMPFRFYEAMCAGMAYRLAMKKPELSQRLPVLKAEYETQFDLASDQDREKATLRVIPSRMYL